MNYGFPLELVRASGSSRPSEIAKIPGPERCVALPIIPAFTGCDSVSCFDGRGKKTAWDTWTSHRDVTAAFCALGAMPDHWSVLWSYCMIALAQRCNILVVKEVFYVYFMFITIRIHYKFFVKKRS